MKTPIDFTQNLLSAVATYVEAADEAEKLVLPADGRPFMKAAVALRAWFRHAALTDKPELVVKAKANHFEVFGGISVVKTASGALKLTRQHGEVRGYDVEVSALSYWLARQARHAVHQHYAKKFSELIEVHVSSDMRDRMLEAAENLSDYVYLKMNVNWWKRRTSIADERRILGKLLWDTGLIDREVFSAAIRVTGFRFNVLMYNACVKHKTELLARINEAPHMAPYLRDWTQSSGLLVVHETVWHDMKAKFLSLGGTPQAWKWLCKQGHTWFKQTKLYHSDVVMITKLAELQLGKVPMFSNIFENLSYKLRQSVELARYLDVFKAGMVAYKKRKIKIGELQDYTLIFDWLDNTPTAVTTGATWASLMRKQARWHIEDTRKKAEERKATNQCFGWQPIVSEVESGSMIAVSLNTSDDLWEEGDAMNHCVGGYDIACYENQSRIYSIRQGDTRVATLEIGLLSGKFSVRQLYGERNRRILDKAILSLAKKVVSACKEAPPLNPQNNAILRKAVNQVTDLVTYGTPEEQAHDLMEIPF